MSELPSAEELVFELMRTRSSRRMEGLIDFYTREVLEAAAPYLQHRDQCGVMRRVCPAKMGGKCACGLDDLRQLKADQTQTRPDQSAGEEGK